jgi:hypothetical protein
VTPHILVVTGTIDPTEGLDERDFTLECPGVTDACRGWIGCDCTNTRGRDLSWEEPLVAHGVTHQYLDGEWMRPTDGCYFAGHDGLPDAVVDLPVDGVLLTAGRYEVAPTYDGDGCIGFNLSAVTAA